MRATCTVRGCGGELSADAPGERVWTCARGHAFDLARSGYANLLQPGDRRSLAAGDSREAVEARARLDERNFDAALHKAVEDVVRAALERAGVVPGARPALLEVGAGGGALLARLAARLELEGWAVELSTPAVQRGSRRHPDLGWIVANADRRLPFAAATFDAVLSSRAPRNPAEFWRVSKPGAPLILVVPAADDLAELREAVLGNPGVRTPATGALAACEAFYACREQRRVSTRHKLGRAELADLLAATYRGARFAQRRRLDALEALLVTSASEILLLERRDAPLDSR